MTHNSSLPGTLSFTYMSCVCVQLIQALAGKFNAHVHVEYEWCLQHEDLDESDEDLDEKVRSSVLMNPNINCRRWGGF